MHNCFHIKLSTSFQDVCPMLNFFQGLAMHHTEVNTFKVIGRGMRKPTDSYSCYNTAIMYSHLGITVRVQSVVIPYMERTMWLPPPLKQKKTLALTLKMAMGIYI
jgi:hypothetical protein